MNTDTKPVTIACPSCKKEVTIEIPSFLVREAQDGILKIQIPQDRCCSLHSFMVFIDKNFTVRGYQYADIEFNMKPAKPFVKGDDEEAIFDTNELLDAVGIDVAAMMLRTVLVNRPIVFLNTFDLNNYVRKTMQFFQDIDSDEIGIKTRVIDEKNLNDKKSDIANAFVYAVLYKAIIRSPFRDKIKTALEGGLLDETAAIPDRQGQVAFLRKELAKISKIIGELAVMLKTTPKIYEEDLPDLLLKKFNYKIKRNQSDGIKEIIAYRYGDKIAGKIRSKTIDYML
ncbi:MAG TPA: hypothetical protein VKM55_25105 [Candidatus Lokiarchaeia archaeon]|nr:hypothetical protein [Candidatus Lokiarchaeia archaeon]